MTLLARRRPAVALAVLATAAATVAATTTHGAAAHAAAGPSGGPAACTGSHLSLTVPASDPFVDEFMGKVIWTVVLTNVSGSACSVAGTPALDFSAAGTALGLRTVDVADNDEFDITGGPVVLAPSAQAGASVIEAGSGTGCTTGWRVGLALPDGGGRLTEQEPADGFGPCRYSGTVAVSPLFPVSQLRDTFTPKPAPASATPQCGAGALAAGVAGTVDDGGYTAVVLRLTNSGRAACRVSGFVPTVRLGADGGAPMAKMAPSTAIAALRHLLPAAASHDYLHAPELAPAHSLLAAVATRSTGAGCTSTGTLSVYPTALATGAHTEIDLAGPLASCGRPLALPFLVDTVGAGSLDPATAGAVKASIDAVVSPMGDTTGYYYGTDTNNPKVTGSAPYHEPVPSGHALVGHYGWYAGEIGNYFHWKGCGATHNIPVDQNVNAANTNLVSYGIGMGTSAYWMMAGAGADPNYDGTNAEATAFGKAQAEHVVNSLKNDGSGYWTNQMIYADIENVWTTGWNERWSGQCGGYGGTEKASSVPADLDMSTLTGFMHYVYNNSAYFAGTYCAQGGSGSNGWGSIFGTLDYPYGDSASGPEWTYNDETSSLATYPDAWAVDGVQARFYGGVDQTSPHRAGAWQWSGGNGTSNGMGDFDQVETGSMAGQTFG